MRRLRKVEKEILRIHRMIITPSKDLLYGIDYISSDDQKKMFIHELEKLKTERKFLLDRRESWLPKTLWMVLVPIAVSIVAAVGTSYILQHTGIGK